MAKYNNKLSQYFIRRELVLDMLDHHRYTVHLKVEFHFKM